MTETASQPNSSAAKLSCYIMTFNSERRLAAALRSVHGVADDLLVVDSGSTDNTEQIAQDHGARFVPRPFDDFTRHRRYCVSQCRYDWILTIDSDEVLSDALRERLIRLKADLAQIEADAFGIRREWYLLGRHIHCFYPSHCPDRPIRLFRRDKASYIEGRHVHEAMTGFAHAQPIDEAILHYTADSIDDIYAKLNLYSNLAAKDAWSQGKRSSWLKIALLPWALAAKWYLVDGGWKDGMIGVVHALYVRDMVYQKWLKLKLDMGSQPDPTLDMAGPASATPAMRS